MFHVQGAQKCYQENDVSFRIMIACYVQIYRKLNQLELSKKYFQSLKYINDFYDIQSIQHRYSLNGQIFEWQTDIILNDCFYHKLI